MRAVRLILRSSLFNIPWSEKGVAPDYGVRVKVLANKRLISAIS